MRRRLHIYSVVPMAMVLIMLLFSGMVVTRQNMLAAAEIPFYEHTLGPLSLASSVYAVDLDGDGDEDVVAAGASGVVWWENDGEENFSQHPVEPAVGETKSVFAIDLDGDLDVDILGAVRSDDQIVWWENDGNESFALHVVGGSFDYPRSVYATDLDGDDDVDVLGAAYYTDAIRWWENNGSEIFTPHTVSGSFDGATCVYAADVDGDGDDDVLGAASVGNSVVWWENDGTGGFTEHLISSSVDSAESVYVANVDGDGDVDVLVAGYGHGISWWENDGSQGFSEHAVVTDAVWHAAYSVQAADVDGDGDTDVIGGAGYYGGHEVAWFENDGSQGFSRHTIASELDTRSICAADIDQDGDIDVSAAGWMEDTVGWWEQGAPIPNVAPSLSWPGDENYESDGLHPEKGGTSDVYAYRIRYTDDDGDPPAYVQVHVRRTGVEMAGSPFTMTCESGDYAMGVICSHIQAGLELGTDYSYYFVAQDDQGDAATPTAESDAPDVIVVYEVYLPLVLGNAGPPSAPVLHEITNPNGLPVYTVSWDPVDGVATYTLEEADNPGFVSPTTVYLGPSTSTSISVGAVGTYYYHVQATNPFGISPWSNVVSVEVTTTIPIPEPARWYCSAPGATVRFTVASDSGSATDGWISISCGSKTIPGPAPIEEGSFTLAHSDGFSFISGTFEDVDRLRGSFGIRVSSSCWMLAQMTCSP